MNLQLLKEHIEGIDIYILDLILKGRYQPGSKILDAGCGNGRNLKWFYAENFEIHGIDTNLKNLQTCKEIYKLQHTNFIQATVEKIPYESNSFGHVICSAVLHFAKDVNHFYKMFEELLRVLKPEGVLFIRLASNLGIENQVKHLANGVYELPDGSTRFILTQKILDEILNTKGISLEDNVKTTIVHTKRIMTTLIIKKE
ncbi:MAG: methyltransferase domain-containing protein [Lutibacter sp.]|uniref:class I SAM-dependent methyltransferase n=1 Tax=Lutibacter sp. TaxID=1925666 RepID=UPI0019F781D6|nr:class I SAM-dependent methyltransferase [Lutibacter sp.]NOR28480.1 methyltransferase domain-containing protein [Lutibacter sp.]